MSMKTMQNAKYNFDIGQFIFAIVVDIISIGQRLPTMIGGRERVHQ